jgi:diguanylate cyclase (GGDEF)-like protein
MDTIRHGSRRQAVRQTPAGSTDAGLEGGSDEAALPLRAGVPAAVRALHLITGALVVLYLGSTIFRKHPSTITFYDGWVGNLAYLGCAALAGLRAALVPDRQRAGWAAMAVSLGLFAAGNLAWTTYVQFMDPVPFPSLQDALFLPFYPIAYVGLFLLARDALPRRGASAIWLDGLIAAIGVAALGAVTLIAIIDRANSGDTGDVITNFAYPVGALVLVTMLVAIFAVLGWRPGRGWWLLGGGLALFAVADSVYSVQALEETYVTGTVLDSLWMIGTLLMATAAWQTSGAPSAEGRKTQPVVVPGIFLMSSLCIVVYATFHDVLPLGVILATCTLLLAIVRMGFAFRQLQTLAESKREARTDELTGLPNRRLFYETLRSSLESDGGGRHLAVLMIDLDRFKEINDSLGHHVGDEVLRQLGPRLATVVDGHGTVARLGGDEFGLLLSPLHDDAQATAVAERVRDDLRRSFLLENITLHVDASIGIAIAPEHGEAADTLLQRADVAMYEAKRSHEPWQVYSPFRDRHTRDRLELMEDVRDAIGRSELVLFYQPKLDVASGIITGVEALVRWQHPTRGLLTPDRFLTLFEQSGMMGPLAMSVLELAMIQQAEWARDGIKISMAVNLSAANLADEQLPEKISEVFDRLDVDPSNVVLEITEDGLMVDAEQSLQVLERLHAGGVELSVDDYGTGFSSLAYLRDLPVNELKLDRAFLAAAANDDRAVAIIRSTIDLAHALELRIVAEGVETPANLALIAKLGCDTAQGYLLGKPLPAGLLFPSVGAV